WLFVLDDFDCELRAIGPGEIRLVLEPGRDRPVAALAPIAQLVEFEQLRGKRKAAGVPLALFAVDPDPQLGLLSHGDDLASGPEEGQGPSLCPTSGLPPTGPNAPQQWVRRQRNTFLPEFHPAEQKYFDRGGTRDGLPRSAV